ncbi:MAG: BolA family transcriptional regulator [Gammaproteobacteria bacterium]|nr:MAG: BolA family transcriptional regulator [Gammaproteobacteria bacterium]
MTQDRQALIRMELEKNFQPTELLIKDQSHLHAGHAGAKDGKGHFDVTIVSQAFDGVNRLQRHRMVYAALSKLIETDIHALSVKALTPSER